MKKVELIKPADYAENESSFESEVLRFERQGDTVELVLCYAWEFEIWSWDYAEFRRIVFSGVHDFTQSEVRFLGRFGGKYQASADEPGVIVVTREEFTRCDEGFAADYCFSDLGGFEFRFESAVVEKMPVRAVAQVGEEWQYADESGNLVDLYEPFS